ncbi:uncharacterized protein LOC132607970 [Lycium barbarum]|uniref:uncharacterized protein LOC132607970 n=1 Tax=Lycium barbarum TaxID=112863 RepID=UPI00293EE744|nr:uncharacterized protein LOC132607970 [Lycium barbarum]
MTGNSSALFVSHDSQQWIIDSGATDHMTSNLNLLDKNTLHKPEVTKRVILPNREVTHMQHTGTSAISPNSSVHNISVLFTGKVKEIGKEDDGLYYLIRSKLRLTKEQILGYGLTSACNNDDNISLWHRRMGHALATVLQKLFPTKLSSITFLINNCTVCPCARNLVHIPLKKSIAERKHRHILELTRAMRFQAHMPLRLWGHRIQAVVYILNRLPSTVLNNMSLYEELVHKKPSLITPSTTLFAPPISVFEDSDATVKRPTNNAQVSENTDIFPTDRSVEVPENQNAAPEVVQLVHNQLPAPALENAQPRMQPNSKPLKQSTRGKHPPCWMKEFVSLNVHEDVPFAIFKYISCDHLSSDYKAFISAISNTTKPKTFVKAKRDPKWVEAMQAERDAL